MAKKSKIRDAPQAGVVLAVAAAREVLDALEAHVYAHDIASVQQIVEP